MFFVTLNITVSGQGIIDAIKAIVQNPAIRVEEWADSDVYHCSHGDIEVVSCGKPINPLKMYHSVTVQQRRPADENTGRHEIETFAEKFRQELRACAANA